MFFSQLGAETSEIPPMKAAPDQPVFALEALLREVARQDTEWVRIRAALEAATGVELVLGCGDPLPRTEAIPPGVGA